MRMILFFCCVCGHTLGALFLYFRTPGQFNDLFLSQPVLSGIMLYFGWRLSRDDDSTLFHGNAVGAFLPALLVALLDFVRLSGSVFLYWQIRTLPPFVTSDEIVFGTVVGVVFVAAMSIVNICWLVSIYKIKLIGMDLPSEVRERQWLSIGGFQVSLAVSLWVNLGLILVSTTVAVISFVWVKSAEFDLQLDATQKIGEMGFAQSLISWDLAQSDFESGNIRLIGIEGPRGLGQGQAVTSDGKALKVVVFQRRKGENETIAKAYKRFSDSYNFKMRQLIEASEGTK